MRRSQATRNSPSVSLFPFLAVLICTMGALIVLLVLVVQQARVNATVISEQKEAETAQLERRLEQARMEREDQQWRVEILEQSRDKKTQELADLRGRLGHLEEHIRQLEQRWERLKQKAAEMDRLKDSRQQDVAQLAQQLQRTQDQLQRAREQLAKARKTAAERPRSYALIPYDGPNGTRRRPIYLECTDEGVLIQPEGVLVTAADLEGVLGPGNPLDAALRTVREYLVRSGASDEPYPLLVVRPDGVATYGMARAAMRSWDDEFGYELVEEELQLAYTPADPRLAESLRKSIELARDRQKRLQQAMPRSFGGQGAAGADGYVVSAARGGVVPLNGAPRSRSKKKGRGFGEGEGGAGAGGGQAEGYASRSDRSSRDGGEADGVRGPAAEQPGEGRPGAAPGSSGGGAAPLAQQRGADFALLNKSPGATAYTRPIRIDCFADRIVVQPEAGVRDAPFSQAIQGPLTDQIDPLLTAIQKHIEGWGLAAGGGYWKPDLLVFVAPGGEARFREFQLLLENSGLVVKRIQQP